MNKTQLKKIKCNEYTFRVKWGKKYIAPRNYAISYYKKKQIPSIIKEIEIEYPRYKNRVFAFEMVLERVK